jgi:pyrimidine operon attenuation protein/uracil phosphoribosyltransferase
MIKENHIILDNTQINQKIKRIAYQIYESNSSEKEIIIAGIVGNGFIFSKKIAEVLEEISTIKVTR